MRILIAALLLFCFALGAHASDTFRGLTIPILTGGDEFISMHRLCRITFGDARMCTSSEIAGSAKVSEVTWPLHGAWVNPVFGAALDAEGTVLERESFLVGERLKLSCDGWTSTIGKASGLVFTGSFDLAPCVDKRPVACCGLVEEI